MRFAAPRLMLLLVEAAALCAATSAACHRPASPDGRQAAPAPSSATVDGASHDIAVGNRTIVSGEPTSDGVTPPLPGEASASAALTTPRRTIRHVIIISEDGLRPDALMDVRPPVHDAIMKKGAYSLQARTIRQASTLPAHASMLSGFNTGEHGLSWNSWQPQRGYIHVPTIFDAACRAGGKAAAFVGKRKLEHIAHPGSVDVFSRPGLFCKTVVQEAARYFVDKKPEVEFIHFSDPDERGHAVGWMSDPQMDAIRHTDRCLGTLVDAVTAAGMDNETLFILSADHGGHGRNHSGSIKEDRLIPWIAWGPGVRRGHRIVAAISTLDTAATALWALGYPDPPGLQGHPVLEAFEPAVTTTAVAPAEAELPESVQLKPPDRRVARP